MVMFMTIEMNYVKLQIQYIYLKFLLFIKLQK